MTAETLVRRDDERLYTRSAAAGTTAAGRARHARRCRSSLEKRFERIAREPRFDRMDCVPKMRGASRQGRSAERVRPIMALLELLERRWALRIIWELRGDRLTSRQLRETCNDLSPTVLQTRVTELRAADIVDLEPRGGYGLTTMGRELLELFMPLYHFAERWADRGRGGTDEG